MNAKHLLIACALGFASRLGAQELVSLDSSGHIAALDKHVTLTFRKTPLVSAVDDITRAAALTLTFDPKLRGLDKDVWATITDRPARDALRRVLEGSLIAVRVSEAGQVVLVPRMEKSRVSIHGRVRAPDGNAIAGARVELVNTRFAAFTRDDGTFQLTGMSEGTYAVRALFIGHAPATQLGVRAAVADSTLPVEFTLAPIPIPLAAVVVAPAYYGLLSASIAAPMTLDRQQLQTTPQIGEDIYRAVSKLPGVAADDFTAKFSVRGATTDELLATLDGIQLVEPFHLRDMGSALSSIDIQTLGSVELLAGGAPVMFGDHTGGVLSMNTIEPRTDRVHGSAGISVMNARAAADGGAAQGRIGWLASVRRGYLDLAFRMAGFTDTIEPRYDDWYAKIKLDAGRLGTLSVHTLAGQDRLKYFQNGLPALRSKYMNQYVWANWRGNVGSDRITHQTVVSASWHQWQRAADKIQLDTLTSYMRETRSLTRHALRSDWDVVLLPQLLLRAGAEVQSEDADYNYISWVRKRFVFNDTLRTRVDTIAGALSPAGQREEGHAALRVRPSDALTMEAGVRYDRVDYSHDRIVSPRFNVAWTPHTGTSVKAAWGRHVQPQPLFDLQIQNGERTFSPADRAEQREVGVEQAIGGAFTVFGRAYERRMTDLRARWMNVGSAQDMVPELNYDRVRLAPSSGEARGLELGVARLRRERSEWSVTYALSKVTERYMGVDIPRARDQRHAVTAEWAIQPLDNRWRLTVAGVWHSGWPYTPDRIIVDSVPGPNGQGQSIYTTDAIGLLNSARTPEYHRVDARWTRYFEARHHRFILFAEVFNLLGTQNIRGYRSYAAFSRNTLNIYQDARESIGRLPSIGFSWEF